MRWKCSSAETAVAEAIDLPSLLWKLCVREVSTMKGGRHLIKASTLYVENMNNPRWEGLRWLVRVRHRRIRGLGLLVQWGSHVHKSACVFLHNAAQGATFTSCDMDIYQKSPLWYNFAMLVRDTSVDGPRFYTLFKIKQIHSNGASTDTALMKISTSYSFVLR